MLQNYFLRIALLVTLCIGHSYVLNAQCAAGCSRTTQYKLNEVVICHKGDCGEDGTFSFSRSASLFTTVTFQTEGIPFCIDPSDKFHIDFGDGNGFQLTNGLTTFVINYPTPKPSDPSANIKTIKIRKGASGVVFETKFMIKSPTGQYYSPDFVKRIDSKTAFNPATELGVGVTANMFPSNGAKYLANAPGVGHAYVRCSPQNDQKIKKPVIFVDGIDFGSEDKNFHDPALGAGKTDQNVIRHGVTGWDIFIMGAEDGFSEAEPNAREDFREYPNVFEQLWADGYDVIFLDFAEGATWIQKNAQVLQALILWVNEEKTKNDSNAENIIVGPSMGGQVARVALAEMERQNIPHCTKMYISFDSPHQGAHIPLGLQSIAWAAYDSNFSCDRWAKLNQPAARQLLTYHLANEMGTNRIQMSKTLIEPPINTGPLPILVKASQEENKTFNNPNDGGIIRAAYVNYLNTIGYPKQTNNLAIADGNINGLKQAANNGDKLFDGNIHITNNASMVINALQGLGQALPFPLSTIQPKFTISPSAVDELNMGAVVVGLQALNTLPIISTYATLNNSVDNNKKRVIDLKVYALPGTNNAEGTFNLHGGAIAAQGDFLHLNFDPTRGNNTIFEWSLPENAKRPSNYFKYHAKINPTATAAYLNLDNVPGAGRSDLIGIEDILNEEGKIKALGVNFAATQFNTQLHRSPLNFISTFSALDVQEPMTNVSLNSPIKPKIDNNPLIIPFERHYGPAITPNLNHVEVDVPMRNQVMAWLKDYEADDLLLVGDLPNNGKQVYNFGLWRKRVPSTNIYSTGELRVNNDGATAFVNEGVTTKTAFEVWLSGCSGSTVNIEEGGKFIIGADTDSKKGIVHVPNGSRINVQGGTLKLQKGSELLLENNNGNTNLYLQSGITELYQDSKIIAEKGAKMTVVGTSRLTLYNTAQIIVQNGGTLDISGGTITLLDESRVVIAAGATCMIRRSAYLHLRQNANFVVEAGAMVTISDDAEVLIENESKIMSQGEVVFTGQSKTTLGNAATIVAQAKGKVMFMSGSLRTTGDSRLMAQESSTLHFTAGTAISMRHLSDMFIEQKAKISFDGPVRITGDTSLNQTISHNPLIVKGYIEMNRSVRFFGAAHFELFGARTKGKRFHVIGEGGNIRNPNSPPRIMIRLVEGSAFFPRVEEDFILERGQVFYENESTIDISESGTANAIFNNVNFKGHKNGQSTVALNSWLTMPRILDISACEFEDLDNCINIYMDNAGQAAPAININTTRFLEYRAGALSARRINNINIKDSYFSTSLENSLYSGTGDSYYASAINLTEINRLSFAILDNTFIEHNVTWDIYPKWFNGELQSTNYEPFTNYTDDTDPPIESRQMLRGEEYSWLINLNGVANFHVINGSRITGGYYGILGRLALRDGSPIMTNIHINKSRIDNNFVGINLTGTPTPIDRNGDLIVGGGLSFRCSSLDDNVFGVFGRNIFVDANTTTQDGVNTFGVKTNLAKQFGKYFVIGYHDTINMRGALPPTNGLKMPNNLWLNDLPEPIKNHTLTVFGGLQYCEIDYIPTAQVANCDPAELQDVDAIVSDMDDDASATVQINGEPYAMMSDYMKGMIHNKNQDLEATHTAMRHIMNVPYEVVAASTNPLVKQLYNMAWTFVPRNTLGDAGNSRIQATPKTIGIYPNPADDYLYFDLPNNGNYEVILTDILGHQAIKTNITQGQNLDTESLHEGIYQVSIRKDDTLLHSTKIIILH